MTLALLLVAAICAATGGFALVLRSDPALRHHVSAPQTRSLHPAGRLLLARYRLENGDASIFRHRLGKSDWLFLPDWNGRDLKTDSRQRSRLLVVSVNSTFGAT